MRPTALLRNDRTGAVDEFRSRSLVNDRHTDDLTNALQGSPQEHPTLDGEAGEGSTHRHALLSGGPPGNDDPFMPTLIVADGMHPVAAMSSLVKGR